MARLGTNLFFKTIAGGFVCALLAVALTVVGLGQHASLIITGAIMTMPGLPKKPAADNIDVDENGKITGLF